MQRIGRDTVVTPRKKRFVKLKEEADTSDLANISIRTGCMVSPLWWNAYRFAFIAFWRVSGLLFPTRFFGRTSKILLPLNLFLGLKSRRTPNNRNVIFQVVCSNSMQTEKKNLIYQC